METHKKGTSEKNLLAERSATQKREEVEVSGFNLGPINSQDCENVQKPEGNAEDVKSVRSAKIFAKKTHDMYIEEIIFSGRF